MIKITDPILSPTLEARACVIGNDGSLNIMNKNKPWSPLEHNHAFFWMLETWLKNNSIPYKIDRDREPISTQDGIRVFGKELSDMDWFIQNLQ